VIERALAIFLMRRSMSAGLLVRCFGEPSAIRTPIRRTGLVPWLAKRVSRLEKGPLTRDFASIGAPRFVISGPRVPQTLSASWRGFARRGAKWLEPKRLQPESHPTHRTAP
jgi:hypothetical protein